MTRQEEFEVKVERLRVLMAQKGWGSVVLGTQANFAWLSCGGEAHIALNSVEAAAKLIVLPDRVLALTNNIEAPRIGQEELADLGIEVLADDWWGKARSVQDLIPPGKFGCDLALPGAESAAGDMLAERLILTPSEITRYRDLGRRAENAIRTAARSVRKGDSEAVIAGKLARETYAHGATPVVCLIAADQRILKHRHPIPKNDTADKCAMLVLCARRYGLILSATRLVHFGPIPDELRRKHEAVMRIDATFILGSVPGRTYGEVFADAVAAYKETGFAEEWKLHHQGGPTGYNSRDFKATLDSKEVVQQSHAIAWNPSITGTKSEDTIIVGADGPEVISEAKDWPMVECQIGSKSIRRPDILEL